MAVHYLVDGQLRKMTELALIRAIPSMFVNKLKNGRLKGQLKGLVKEVDLQLSTLPRPSQDDINIIDKKLTLFGMQTGWEGKPRHVVTLVSFCLDMIEMSDHKFRRKIIKHLNHIFDYYERVGDTTPLSFWSGSLAAKKWEELFF